MPPATATHPTWWAALCALRDLTRLAATVLVLAVGLGGATLALTEATATASVAPTVVTSHVADLRPEPSAVTTAAEPAPQDQSTAGEPESPPPAIVAEAAQRAGSPLTPGVPDRRGPPQH
ncbi:hypothetical protein [Micromonospora sp. SH-82]|uniref:hypothetical protein n=1 Tax=Micromonospora sp. SH-82 TaxID=3132938 RepID=UPI003EBA7DBB